MTDLEGSKGRATAEAGGLAGPGTIGEAATERSEGAGGPEREFTVEARTQSRMVFDRFLHHRLAVVSMVILVILFFLALFGGRIWHYKYSQLSTDYSRRPTWWPYFNGTWHWSQLAHWKHPMGTDGLGHDTFAQVLRGAQKSVLIALVVALGSTVVGTIIGAVAGYYRGAIDTLAMRLVDLFLTFPIIAVAGVIDFKYSHTASGWISIAIVLAALSWMSICRVVRGVILSLREKEFVDAARALGASDARIIFRHLLPNVVGPVIVNATLSVALAILSETILSYVGLGVQPPDTSLGLLISTGEQAAQTRPWLFYFPGLFIILIALSVNFVGDGLRDAFDPSQNRVRA